MVPLAVGGLSHTLGVAALVGASLLQGAPPGPGASAEASATAEADRLHGQAGQPGQAVRSLGSELALLEGALAASPSSYPLLWRAARAQNQLATRLSGRPQRGAFAKAIALGQRAVAARGDGVEGHYWLGASYGRAAEARRGIGGFFLARRLRVEMEAVLRLQPGYEGGDAFLALGELDRGLPGLLGGDAVRGRRTLEQGLRVAPENAELKLALAEAYLEQHRRAEASSLLEEIVAAASCGAPLDESVVRRARERLATLGPPAAASSPDARRR